MCGSDKVAVFIKMFNRELFIEVPKRLRELLSGGIVRSNLNGDSHWFIGGATILISKSTG